MSEQERQEQERRMEEERRRDRRFRQMEEDRWNNGGWEFGPDGEPEDRWF